MHVIMNIYYNPGLILSSATFNFNISLSGKTFEKKKERAESICGFSLNCYLCFRHKTNR